MAIKIYAGNTELSAVYAGTTPLCAPPANVYAGDIPLCVGQIPFSGQFNVASSSFMQRNFLASSAFAWSYSLWAKTTGASVNNVLIATWQTSGVNEEQVYISLGTITMYDGLNSASLFASTQQFSQTWEHMLFVYDSANPTATDRIRVYIDGVRIVGTVNVALNRNSYINSYARVHTIGRLAGIAGNYLDGNLSEVRFIDGQTLTPDAFGEFDGTGKWRNKEYAGAYGTNGFYLDFQNASNLGEDKSGNGNNWSSSNVTQSTDTPTSI